MGRLRLHDLMLLDLMKRKPEGACASRLMSTVPKHCSGYALERGGVCSPKARESVHLLPSSGVSGRFLLHRLLSAAVHVEEQPHSEASTSTTDSANADGEVAASDEMIAENTVRKKRVWKEKPSADVAVQNFFDRMNVTSQVVSLLKTMEWGEELQASLQSLVTKHGSQLISEVLRADIPCGTALNFFKWLKSLDGFNHNENSYGVMLDVLGLAGRIAEMKELYNEMISEGCKATAVITSNVMMFLSRERDFEEVRQHFQRVKNEGAIPSLGIYNAYLDMLVRAEDSETLVQIYQNMLSDKSLPNARTFTLFIKHMVHAGKLDPALEIMRTMKKVRLVPSRVTYELIIGGYAKAGNIDVVKDLLSKMKEQFHKPSKRLLPVVRALQVAGKAEEALSLYRDICPSEADNSDEIGNLDEQLKEQDVADVSDGEAFFMNEWRSATRAQVGFDVNGFACALRSWNPLVKEALEKIDVEWNSSLVFELLRRLRNLETSWPFFHWVKHKTAYKHNIYCCMQMIQRVLKSEAPVEKKGSLLEDLFEEFKQDGVKLCAPMFNMVMRHYVAVKELKKAVDMFDTMKGYDVEPNKASYAVHIDALAKDRRGKRAMDMYTAMEQAGFQPESSTTAELITCLALADKLEDAQELFDKILESGRSPSSLEYKAMMTSYYRAGDQYKALAIYQEMRRADMRITQDMYDVVVAILRGTNKRRHIEAIEKYRSTLKYFNGRKKEYQENLLEPMYLLVKNIMTMPKTEKAKPLP